MDELNKYTNSKNILNNVLENRIYTMINSSKLKDKLWWVLINDRDLKILDINFNMY